MPCLERAGVYDEFAKRLMAGVILVPKLTETQKQALAEAIFEAIDLTGDFGNVTIVKDSGTVARIEASPSILVWVNGKRIDRQRAG